MLVLDLRKKTSKELIIIEEKSRAELFALKFQLALGNLDKPHRIKNLKILIARILTILNERKLSGEKINRHFKIDLSKKFQEIEKETKKMFLKRKNQLIKKENNSLTSESKKETILSNLARIESKNDHNVNAKDDKKLKEDNKTNKKD